MPEAPRYAGRWRTATDGDATRTDLTPGTGVPGSGSSRKSPQFAYQCALAVLRAERAGLLAQAERILDRARASGGRWSDRDEAEFNRLHDQAAAVQVRINSWTGAGPESAARSAAFGAYLRGAGVNATLRTDAAADGGYLAPPEFVAGLVKGLDDGSWFRRLATVRTPTAAEKVVQATRVAQTQAVQWSAELTPPADDTALKFGGYALTPHYMTGEFQIAITLANTPGAMAVIQNEMKAAAATVEERAFVAGDGAGKPLGLFCPNDGGIGTARDLTADPTDLDTWIAFRLSLRSVYLRSPSLRLVMHPNAYKVALGLADADGRRLVTRPADAGGKPHVDGVGIELTDDAPAGSGPNGTYVSGDYMAVIGDMSFYDIQDGAEWSVTRPADSGYIRRGLVGYIFRRKVDGCPRAAEAFARLKVA